MPLKLIPPRAGKTPNYSIRGTYLGQYVDRTAGTPDKATARKILKKIEDDIESGIFTRDNGPTFADAALAYLDAGGDPRFLGPLTEHFKATPLARIDQAAIDGAAKEIYPGASNATRNRQVYTPMSAILKRSGADFKINRPIGGGGNKRTHWLWPEQAKNIFEQAYNKDVEFAIFIIMLCYTGLRLEEGLFLEISMVRLDESYAYIPDTKNGEPRAVYLPPIVVRALESHPSGWDREGHVFRFKKHGGLYNKLKAVFKAAKVPLPPRTAFHIFRHTYGTWMTKYAGLDAKGLRDTGAWKDVNSAIRYRHAIASEEAQKALLLPNFTSGGEFGKIVERPRTTKKVK